MDCPNCCTELSEVYTSDSNRVIFATRWDIYRKYVCPKCPYETESEWIRQDGIFESDAEEKDYF